MRKRTKLLVSAVVVGALGSLAAFGIFGLFSSTTSNSGNEISTGTVALTDNDAGSALFNVTDAKPGDSWSRCIRVAYNGSLPADVHLYEQRAASELQESLTTKLEQGTQSNSTFPNCNGFTPDAVGTIYEGPVNAGTGTYDTGAPVAPAGQTTWEPGDSLVFKITTTLDPAAPQTAQGQTTGSGTIFWEARNDS